jgi:hypothetical protein
MMIDLDLDLAIELGPRLTGTIMAFMAIGVLRKADIIRAYR